MIQGNTNKIRTNTLVTITKKPTPKTVEEKSNYLFCSKCNNILGFEINFIKEEKDSNNTSNCDIYLLKKNIKERNNRNININLVSFKENLLKNVKEEMDSIFKDTKEVNAKIHLTPLTKENFEKFSEFYKKKEFDFTFVIHKMEGRIFLLGKNGYFNEVENCLIKKENSNLFFILITNEIDDKENTRVIEELIYQGGEEELEKYYKNDRIIFLDNYQIKEDLNRKRKWFEDKIYQIFGNDNQDFSKDKYYIKYDRNLYVTDKRKIDNMIEYLTNEKNGHSGCFS